MSAKFGTLEWSKKNNGVLTPIGRYKGPVVALCSGDVCGSDEIARLSFIIRLTNAPATPAIVGEATKREVFPVRIVFLQSQ